MTRLIIANLWGYKRRLLSTMLAVFLGVALLSGTLALGDTMTKSIDSFFAQSNAGVDAVVRNSTSVTDDPGARRGGIDSSLVGKVRRVDGVAAAAPVIKAYGQLVGSDGDAVTGNGPRTAGNWVTDQELNPWQLTQGHAPRTDSQVVIDKASATTGDLDVGDHTTVLTPQPVKVAIAGIATFGASDTFGGTSFTAFTVSGARQHLTKDNGMISSISVRADTGVTEDTVVSRLEGVLPDGVGALSGSALSDENMESVQSSFLDIFRLALTAFAVIALLVATFSIYNTFSIIGAQRRHESALLRAVGATRRQVTISALIEALSVGVVGSALGLGGGVVMAYGLKGLFAGFGMSLPTIELVVTPSSLVISAAVGVLVTVLAGLAPAIRGSRVPPVAALRDTAVEDPSVSRRRTAVGVTFGAIGIALAVAGAVGGAVPLAAIGALTLAVGMVVVGPAAARPAARLLGWPGATARGVTGAMSRQNAMRSPRRTAGAANALLIGVALVSLVSVFAASLQASVEDRVGEAFAGDLAVTAGTGFGGAASLSPKVADRLRALQQVQSATTLTSGRVRVDGESSEVTVGKPAHVADALSLQTTAGSLTGHGIAVSAPVAQANAWEVGSAVPVTFKDGARKQLPIDALYDESPVVGDYLLPSSTWSAHTTQDLDSVVYLSLVKGADIAEAETAVEDAVAPYGAPTVQDRDEYVDAQGQSVGMLLNLVYLMLALAIIIALMGIANTTALSVRERTRELGLLRAVGQTRRQMRAMVRGESMIVAVFGTVGGLALGTFLGVALAQAIDDVDVITVPLVTLLVILVVGAIAGVLAGRRPARRAARTDVLTAIAVE